MTPNTSSRIPVVWLIDPVSVPLDVVEAARPLLDDDECRRADRFVYAAHRHLFLVAHVLGRLALSAAFPDITPAQWRFAVNAWGRPALAPPWDATGLHFNLSHTTGLAACIVAGRYEAGVDVEDRTRQVGGPAVAERFFAAREVRALREGPASGQRDMFFRFWTLKEAYIKARGRGISLGLDRFWFDLTGETPRIGWDPGLDEEPDSWCFIEARPTGRHALAVAIRDRESRTVPVDIRRASLERHDNVVRLRTTNDSQPAR